MAQEVKFKVRTAATWNVEVHFTVPPPPPTASCCESPKTGFARAWRDPVPAFYSERTAVQVPHVAAQQNGSTAGSGAAAAAPAAASAGAAGPSLQPAVTHVQRDAPGEVAATSNEEDYLEYRETTDMREPYRQGGWVYGRTSRTGAGCWVLPTRGCRHPLCNSRK